MKSDPNFAGPEKALRDAIARKEKELRTLKCSQAAAERDLHHLKVELKSSNTSPSDSLSKSSDSYDPAILTGAKKIELFRSLFRGRDDIFPSRWINQKTGRSGYAPVCGNEWKPGICSKPRIRCADCSNQAFLPVSDRVVLDHFQGRHVIGVYPLLLDETCWFLAVDFDKGNWMKDITAFREVCDCAGLSVAIERSRSGNGAHAWFFFDAPVPASEARRMGCFLITQTMSKCDSLEMSSYDRLFPNQDYMPKGGFGNLIALPLQREPRWEGNTVFVDDNFHPFSDQWAYLASLKRISAFEVERVTETAAKSRQELGIRASVMHNKISNEPWLLLPSRRSKHPAPSIEEPVPARVQATVAQRLFIEKAGLPSPVLNALKRLAAFQNPEFYKKQSMRFSTALTPRIIACAEDYPGHIALPRGCIDDATSLLCSLGATLEIDDRRQLGQVIEHRFRGTPTELQENAVRAMLRHDTGIMVAPPGVGKTVAGILLIATRARNSLVLVHRQPLLDQWVAQLAMFFDIEPGSIGRIGGGKRHLTGMIDVAMIQSLVHKDEVADLVADYGHVVVDECHHVSAVSFERVLAEVKARYVTGLTATPMRRDRLHPIFEMQLGPARYVADRKSLTTAIPFARRLIVRETAFELVDSDHHQPIQRIYQSLCRDEQRNALIIDDIINSLATGRSPIVLTERKDHLEFLSERLRGFTKHLIVLKGGMTAKKRSEALAAISAIPDSEERLILATGRYIGEGFDDVRLDTLFLTLPVSWRGTIVQYTGRLHRLHPGKTEVQIYDYVDRRNPVLARMYDRRLAGYRSIGYQIEDDLST